VQTKAKAQRRAVKMEQRDAKAIAKKRHVILEIDALLKKGIKIPDPERSMWIKTKQNNDKHVMWTENWKDIAEEEN
jgi:hypothetical protein